MRKLAIAVLLAVGTVACSQPRLDTTTVETTAASIEKMSKPLSEEKRQRLANATTQIMAAEGLKRMQGEMAKMMAGMGDVMAGKAAPPPPTTLTPDATMAALLKRANGMTADEIIALGGQVAKEVQQQRP